jgi:LmbE family N-acetylglucosaminyl deacetylase
MAERRHNAAVIVAHPDDEILWCGGQILEHPGWHWHIVTMCRESDPDRAPRFRKVLGCLAAEGGMGDLDDGPEQIPLPVDLVEEAIGRLLPRARFDVVLTHGPDGEYTRHRRHEECSRAVVSLWQAGRIDTGQLWQFAYEDGKGAYLPRAQPAAHRHDMLAEDVWHEKRNILSDLYGFSADSWELRATPREEGFWCFDDPDVAAERLAACEFKS